MEFTNKPPKHFMYVGKRCQNCQNCHKRVHKEAKAYGCDLYGHAIVEPASQVCEDFKAGVPKVSFVAREAYY